MRKLSYLVFTILYQGYYTYGMEPDLSTKTLLSIQTQQRKYFSTESSTRAPNNQDPKTYCLETFPSLPLSEMRKAYPIFATKL